MSLVGGTFAVLDVTDNLKGIPTAWETAKEIRAHVHRETDFAASAGISCNKLLAKLASEDRKPNGQFAIMPDETEAFVAGLPVAKFHRRRSKDGGQDARPRHRNGRGSPRSNPRLPAEALRQGGSWYFDIERGRDDRAVEPDRERKSSGAERTSRRT
jgi:DNA polymerase-4